MGDGPGTRLPSLGPRGEGWVVAQVVLLAAVALSGVAYRAPGGGDLATIARGLGVLLMVLGAILLGAGTRALGRHLTAMPRPREAAPLVESGVYALVRHPLYGGLVLGAAGWSLVTLTLPAMLLTAVLALVLDLKSRREEAWLRERFPTYPAYAARTRRLIPWVY